MDVRTYDPLDRPACWVWHDHEAAAGWYPGRVHSWHRGTSGWWAVVTYTVDTERGPLQYHHDAAAGRVKDRALDAPKGPPTGL